MPIRKKNKATSPNSVTMAQEAPRNPFSNHPLMRKGGVHRKSKSAERSQSRRETRESTAVYRLDH